MTIEQRVKQLENSVIKLAELVERMSKVQSTFMETFAAFLEKLKYQGITK